MNAQKLNWIGWCILLSLGTLWGGSFLFAKIAVTELNPITLVFLRVAIAALAMWCFLLFSRQSIPLTAKWIGSFLLLGFLNNVVPFSLIFWGQQYITAGLASVLNAFTPIFTMLVMQALSREEKMTMTKLIAALTGIAGVAIMVGSDALGDTSNQLLPQIAVLGGTLSYAFGAFFITRIGKLSPAVLTTGQLSASAILLLPALFYIAPMQQLINASTSTWLSVLILALACTALAFILYFQLFKLAGATNAASVTLLIPVCAILLGALFLNEQLEPNHWLGMAAIFLALILIDGRLAGSWFRKKTALT